MKSKDIGLLAVIAIVSGVVSILISNFFISSGGKTVEVEVVSPITSEFNRPSVQYYNQNSINPTQEIRIEQDPNSKPFN